MSRYSQRRDPNDLTQWLGQPYVPSYRFFRLYGDPLYRFFVELAKHPNKQGCSFAFLIVGTIVFAWTALIVIGFIETSGLGFWALLVLIGAAILGTLAGAAWRRRQARSAHRRHHYQAWGFRPSRQQITLYKLSLQRRRTARPMVGRREGRRCK